MLNILFDFNGTSTLYFELLLSQFGKQNLSPIHAEDLDIEDLRTRLFKPSSQPHLAVVPEDLVTSIPNLSKLQGELCNLSSNGYSIPMLSGNHLLLFFDKRKLARAPSCWQEFPELLAPGCAGCGYDFEEPYWLIPFANAFNATLIEKQHAQLNTPELLAALGARAELKQQNILQHFHYDGPLNDALTSGEVPAIISGEWEYANLKAEMGNHLGIAPIPSLQGRPCQSYFSTIDIVFPSNSLQSSYRPQLLALTKYLLSTPVSQGWFERAGRLSPWSEHVQYRSPWATEIRTALSQSVPQPTSSAMQTIWDVWKTTLRGSQHYHRSLQLIDLCRHSQNLLNRELAQA